MGAIGAITSSVTSWPSTVALTVTSGGQKVLGMPRAVVREAADRA